MKKFYYVVVRNINGKISKVLTFGTKRECNTYANNLIDLGYQVAILLPCVVEMGENLSDVREFIGMEVRA